MGTLPDEYDQAADLLQLAKLLALSDGLRWGTDISSSEHCGPYEARAQAMVLACRIAHQEAHDLRADNALLRSALGVCDQEGGDIQEDCHVCGHGYNLHRRPHWSGL